MMSPLCLDQSDPRLLGALRELLETGGVLIFPTDTVYGLGGNPWDERAVHRVRRMKGRSAEQPFTVHLPAIEAIERVARLDRRTRRAIELVLPGPVTLLLPAVPGAPAAAVRAGKVGVRVPAHPFFQDILRATDGTLFGTSVNRSGEPPLLNLEAMIESFSGVDLIVEADAGTGQASAVIDLTADPFRAVRGTVPEILRSPLRPDTDGS